MTVYVDPSIWPFRQMIMCHMVADTEEGLNAMADRIGVQRKWIQHAGTWEVHYDIAKTKRALAVKAGAVELTLVEMGKWMVAKREQMGARRDRT